ncbi:MAG: threonine-phosphate decarboxylase [Firmicutes bacterium]|nr:threonine-phosphate decarboxylase [Bacillota bacterium]
MTFGHGGDLVSARNIYSGEILDLSVNINPLGTPPAVAEAARNALERVGEYPDPQCRCLRQAIAERDGVSPEKIFCGNGAAEVIFRLALVLRPEKALLTAPTFSEYEAALRQLGCDCGFHVLRQEENFDVTERILEDIVPPVRLVVLCSPNNPTGRLISRELFRAILDRCRRIGAHLMVDECFLPLACGGRGLADELSEWPELFLLRAFTKSYAIPGLRMGYGLGDAGLVERLTAMGPCWNVSGPAQEAGIACCQLPQWPEEGRKLLSQQRPRLIAGLERLGCQVIPGQANYLLFRLCGITDLKERLLRRGVLIRSCANYRGLTADWYRVAVKQEEENQRFLTILREELEE